MIKLILLIFFLIAWASLIESHGRLMDPPARSTAWREDSSRFPAYYNDMEMFCGGKPAQWNENGGKCSICGENWSKSKRFEKGGDLYRGHIVRNYQMNSKIPVTVELTTNHRGWFEFRLCNVDTMPNGEADHDCLNKILLADENGNTRFNTPSQTEGWQGFFNKELVIPKNFKCNHCVLQWKWNVGNSHGYDFDTGEYCLGCGAQEQFYGCSDIRIIDGIFISTSAPTVKPQTAQGALWTQCGGLTWTGSSQCQSGLKCEYVNEWYSQCVQEDSYSDNKQPEVQQSNQIGGDIWNQCGGLSWSGSTKCKDGLKCIYVDIWYSQCLPSN